MQIPIDRRFWIISAIIGVLLFVAINADKLGLSYGDPYFSLEILIVTLTIGSFVLPVLLSVILLLLFKTIWKIIIEFINSVKMKEPFRLQNIFPRSISLPLLVILTLLIYATIVCNSLNSSGGKSPVAAIKSSMTNMRALAELYYDANNSSYGVAKAVSYETCFTEGTMFTEENTKKALVSTGGNISYTKRSMLCAIGQEGKSWAFSVKFRTDKKKNACSYFSPYVVKDFFVKPPMSSWCVDSSGKVGTGEKIETSPDGTVGCVFTKASL